MDRIWPAGAMIMLCLVLAGLANAQTYSVYECKFVVRGMGGEKADIIFAIDANGRAFTYDTKPGSDKPVLVPASLRKAAKDDWIFGYSFDSPNVERRLTIDLQARVPKAGGASRLMMTGRGFSGNPSGKGTCKLHQGVRLNS